MIFFIVWVVILLAWAIPAFPNFEWWFWVLTFCIPPLILIPIIEAVR